MSAVGVPAMVPLKPKISTLLVFWVNLLREERSQKKALGGYTRIEQIDRINGGERLQAAQMADRIPS
jgi:hypothetical protein